MKYVFSLITLMGAAGNSRTCIAMVHRAAGSPAVSNGCVANAPPESLLLQLPYSPMQSVTASRQDVGGRTPSCLQL